MSKGNALANIAKGKSAQDVTDMLDTVANGISCILNEYNENEESDKHDAMKDLEYGEPESLEKMAQRLRSLGEKIACSGKDTILSDSEARNLSSLLADDQEPRPYRLADLVRNERDVEDILHHIPFGIDSLYRLAEFEDREWWDCNYDASDEADYHRLYAMKLRIFHRAISKDGLDMRLSPSQVRLVIEILLKAMSYFETKACIPRCIWQGQHELSAADWKSEYARYMRHLQYLWPTV